jgi:hypothetical protein
MSLVHLIQKEGNLLSSCLSAKAPSQGLKHTFYLSDEESKDQETLAPFKVAHTGFCKA